MIKTLANTRYGYIRIGDIFTTIAVGSQPIFPDFTPGDISYVSSGSKNNGIIGFVADNDRAKIYQHCLTISSGSSYSKQVMYHPYKFYAGKQVTVLDNPVFDRFTYFFLAATLKEQFVGNGFNYIITKKRCENKLLYLPVLRSSKPDYRFMSRYMRNVFAVQEKILYETLKNNVNHV